MRRAKKSQIDTSLFDRIEKLQAQILAGGVYLKSVNDEMGSIINPAISELVTLCKKAGIKLPDFEITPAGKAA
jgi:hypothetical protein